MDVYHELEPPAGDNGQIPLQSKSLTVMFRSSVTTST